MKTDASPLGSLPPPPARTARDTRVSHGAVSREERGEYMWLEILRAPEAYQRAAIYVTKYDLAPRELGPHACPSSAQAALFHS